MNRFDTSLGMLRRVQSGDDLAWSEFASRAGVIIAQWARGQRLQSADADDLTHDTLLVMLAKIKDFRHCGRGSFRGWLRAIAWRCLSRNRNRGNSVFPPELAERYQRSENQIAELEEEFDRLQQMDLLKSAMSSVQRRVRPQTWSAFYLLAIEGLSGQAAASQLNMQVDAVHAAKSRIQKLISCELQRRENLRVKDNGGSA
ncbi:MAG: RNA polymerase sigma factor [Planctomycetaceae bacterium]